MNNNNSNEHKAPKGFLGTLFDVMKSGNDGSVRPRPPAQRQNGGGRIQPKKPCGGCGGK